MIKVVWEDFLKAIEKGEFVLVDVQHEVSDTYGNRWSQGIYKEIATNHFYLVNSLNNEPLRVTDTDTLIFLEVEKKTHTEIIETWEVID